MLILPIKKKWFDMIALGKKKEEYREIKPYYTKRFQNAGMLNSRELATFKHVDIMLRNGYSANAPTLYAQVILRHDHGKPEWGAEEGKVYYCLEIVKLYKLDVNNETVWT